LFSSKQTPQKYLKNLNKDILNPKTSSNLKNNNQTESKQNT
jgi:hypothetical protein